MTTHQDPSTLSHEEIARCVAVEVMGWEPWPKGDPIGVVTDKGHPLAFHQFRPDENIAQAWEVVEKMAERDLPLRCMFKSIHDPGYWARFGEGPQNFYGATAPLAICLAALQAVRGG